MDGYLWCTGFDAVKTHVTVNGLLGWWLGDYFNHFGSLMIYELYNIALSVFYYMVHYIHTLGLFVNCFESFLFFGGTYNYFVCFNLFSDLC